MLKQYMSVKACERNEAIADLRKKLAADNLVIEEAAAALDAKDAAAVVKV